MLANFEQGIVFSTAWLPCVVLVSTFAASRIQYEVAVLKWYRLQEINMSPDFQIERCSDQRGPVFAVAA